jgi:hypothetical protein
VSDDDAGPTTTSGRWVVFVLVLAVGLAFAGASAIYRAVASGIEEAPKTNPPAASHADD